MLSTATSVEAFQLKGMHNEQKRSNIECNNVEKDLLRHTQDALEDKHTEALVDECTNLINDYIPTVLEYLFYSCGKVSSKESSQKEEEVIHITWLLSGPIFLLTRPLQQLKKIRLVIHHPQ